MYAFIHSLLWQQTGPLISPSIDFRSFLSVDLPPRVLAGHLRFLRGGTFLGWLVNAAFNQNATCIYIYMH